MAVSDGSLTYLFIHKEVFVGDFRNGAFDLFADFVDEGVGAFQAEITDLLAFFGTEFVCGVDEVLTDQWKRDSIAYLRWIVDARGEEMIELCEIEVEDR